MPARSTSDAPGDAPSAWHARSAESIATELGTDVLAGLDDAEAASRLARYGPNALIEPRRRGPVLIFLSQFTDFMVLVLLGAAVLAAVIGELRDAAAILAIVLLNATFGFLHEHRTERALATLKAMAAPRARVRRGGSLRDLPAALLVPGDLVLLEAGNVVPADLRIVEATRLRVDEALLTGESHPVDKLTAPVVGQAAALGDRACMAYNGTTVTYGRGIGVVVATGMGTELGRIAELLHETEEGQDAPPASAGASGPLAGDRGAGTLRRHLRRGAPPRRGAGPDVPHRAESGGGGHSGGAARRGDRLPRHRRAPHGASGTRSSGGSRPWRRSARCRSSAPTRPAPSPRTGWGRTVIVPTASPGPELLTALALSNDAERSADGRVHGDPTEVALFEAAAGRGAEKGTTPRGPIRCWRRLPFSPERGMMTTLHRDGAGVVAFTKGAPERCSWSGAPGASATAASSRSTGWRCSAWRSRWRKRASGAGGGHAAVRRAARSRSHPTPSSGS